MDDLNILGVTVRMGGQYPCWETETSPYHWRLGEGGRVQYWRAPTDPDPSAWVSLLPDLELILSVAVAYSLGYSRKRAANARVPVEGGQGDDDDDDDGCIEVLDEHGYTVGYAVSSRRCDKLTDRILRFRPWLLQPRGQGESLGSYASRVAEGQRRAAVFVSACLRAYLAGSDHLQEVLQQGRYVSRQVAGDPAIVPFPTGGDHDPAG